MIFTTFACPLCTFRLYFFLFHFLSSFIRWTSIVCVFFLLAMVRKDCFVWPFITFAYKYRIMVIVWLKRIEKHPKCLNASVPACPRANNIQMTVQNKEKDESNKKKERAAKSKGRKFILTHVLFNFCRLLFGFCHEFNKESIRRQQLIFFKFLKSFWLCGVCSFQVKNHLERQ